MEKCWYIPTANNDTYALPMQGWASGGAADYIFFYPREWIDAIIHSFPPPLLRGLHTKIPDEFIRDFLVMVCN